MRSFSRRLRKAACGAAGAVAVLLDLPCAAQATANAGRRSVEDRIREFGEAASARLLPAFQRAGVPWPPARFALLGFKQERAVELWASEREGEMKWIKTYVIRAASGRLGPKLRQGDMQVPEGIYRIELLNPNSKYHVSLRLDYPNAHDRSRALEDDRSDLGGDIMIHGRAISIGCLAMGDEAAEELFLTAAKSGLRNGLVVLSPVDFRARELPEEGGRVAPKWIEALYTALREQLKEYRHEPAPE